VSGRVSTLFCSILLCRRLHHEPPQSMRVKEVSAFFLMFTLTPLLMPTVTGIELAATGRENGCRLKKQRRPTSRRSDKVMTGILISTTRHHAKGCAFRNMQTHSLAGHSQAASTAASLQSVEALSPQRNATGSSPAQ